MSSSKALTPIAEEDYEAIEQAVMETQRGRWFLAEYARRNRNADTTVLLGAIERLEKVVSREREAERMDRLRFDLVEMARAITSTKREIASIRPSEGAPSDLNVASEALDGIVRTTERATSDILESAEQVQEAAWTLREDGAREDLCDQLDRRATDIYTACSFQDLTAQRTKRIIETLRFLEGRINAMMDIWGATLDDEEPGDADGARHEGLGAKLEVFDGLGQSEIDDVIVASRFGAPMPAEIVDATLIEAEREDDEDAEEEAEAAFEIDVVADLDPAEPALADVADQADVAFVETETTLDVALDIEPLEEDEDLEHEPDDEPALLTADAFAEIDALSTREKLARFS
ncbi:hypothetical protein [Salinarimonas ramus]|uniref:Chemotaxis protein CheZ n=1 Tax=Salinarimonas ramus TaxID=690164 RepID=A0A917Q4I9_9HYPH|nr:hypothetical protein [Salinarimonas ramus]GGK22793.1 hypothetical protein GCM10011322_06890 [Salinarimonas ramus]